MAALRTYLFIVLYVLSIVVGVTHAGACSAFNLRNAPAFPTDTLASALTPAVSSANPLVQGHWSEKSRLSDYRPPASTYTANPSQINCPHKQANLKNWHDASTWPSGVPAAKADVTLPANTAVLVSHCSVSAGTVFGVITVPAGSSLIFDDADISFASTGMIVAGSISAGSETCRLRSNVNITLVGKRGERDPNLAYVKGIAVTGTIDLHGNQYFPTWSRLAMTAKPNDKYIFIQDIVNWQPGQRIVVTTTEVKDSRDFHRNEERIIVSVKKTTLGSAVSAIELDSPLSYLHFGGKEYQAEVSLISRNIVVQGDEAGSLPTDTANYICTDKNSASTYPCNDKFLTGFGAHIIVQGSAAKGRFSGVEMFRVGQTNTLGRYPIHFHMLGNVTDQGYQNHYVRDSAVHDSYFRCYAIHGTQGVKLTQNTAYNAIGHCYFLEDGVEENNEISYNQAALIHPLGPIQNPSNNEIANDDGFWGQYLAYYTESPTLLLPSDMSAAGFYITNTFNDIFGNAASGGWAGFAIPSLPLPVKLHKDIIDMVPANRPFSKPFRGNSAHSSGFWFLSAGAIYVGGELTHRTSDGVLQYTAGRSTSRDTCTDKTAGSKKAGAAGGCYDLAAQVWLDFIDNKVFLSNRGMQNWGNRANIVRLELHDVSLAMNVFGKVWIDDMIMDCRTESRTATNKISFFHGCPKSPTEGGNDWGNCNARDYSFFRTFGGFQWYDVGQQHILTNTVFRNCRTDWERCSNGGNHNCNDVAVFTSLTHSDQFVPELMQVSSGLKYENCGDRWRYSTKRTQKPGITVSGRLQSWYDPDGSASETGKRTMIGSAWSNTWWKYNDECQYYLEAYKCPMKDGDSAASVISKLKNTAESQIGNSNCFNGAGDGLNSCPVIGQVSHFGSKNESAGLAIAVNGKLSGPLIASSGGWFIRYTAGTPKTLTFTSVQVAMNDQLLVALPYPSGTRFTIYHKAADWCGTSWAYCRKDFIAVNSISAVRAAYGDVYYWSESTKTLYLRLVQALDTWGNPYDKNYNNSAPWGPTQPREQFTRAGLTLITPSYQPSIIIESTCTTDPCAPQTSVPIPAVSPITVTSSSSGSISTTGTQSSTTGAAPTQAPATQKPTTPPVTQAPATQAPSTPKPTTAPVTQAPATQAPSTPKPTTAPATQAPSTPKPTTAPVTQAPATQAPSTPKPTTAPSTPTPTNKPNPTTTPATQAPTKSPSTNAPSTPSPTTKATNAPSTPAPTTKPSSTTGSKQSSTSGSTVSTPRPTPRPTSPPAPVAVNMTLVFSVTGEANYSTSALENVLSGHFGKLATAVKVKTIIPKKRVVDFIIEADVTLSIPPSSNQSSLVEYYRDSAKVAIDIKDSLSLPSFSSAFVGYNVSSVSAATVITDPNDVSPSTAPSYDDGGDKIADGSSTLYPSLLFAVLAIAFFM